MNATQPRGKKPASGTKVVTGSTSAHKTGLSKPPKPSGNATK